MKKKILRVLSCLVTVCLTVIVLSKMSTLLERKSSDEKYADFWSQEEDFDVLFMGASHMLNAVFPMELWNDYGIVSYNFGGHSNQIPTTYWVMENALEYTTPKVVVIDCLAVEENKKCSDKFSFLHLSLDTFPTSITKVKAIWDLLDDPVLDEAIANGTARESDEARTKIGLLWDYSVYHSRWNELGEDDFHPKATYEKGAESRIAVTRGKLNKISPDEKMETGSTGETYLRKMIEDCQSRGIEVLLTYLPFPASEVQQKTANYIYDIAEEYGVNYINFLDTDIINYRTDLYDKNSHLNPSGARKVTEYLGDYLTANYDISDRRQNPDYSYWTEDYDEYINLKNKNIADRDKITEYFMLLSGDDVEIRMDIQNKDIFNNVWVMDLLANIGIDKGQISNDTDFIIIKNCGKEVTVVSDLRQNGASQQTMLGEMQIQYNKTGKNYGVYLNNEKIMQGSSTDSTGLQVDVYRGEKRIDSVKFVYTVDPETSDVDVTSVTRQ